MDPDEEKVVSDVEQFGWHVVKIIEDQEGPAFAYSIGLFKSFGQPEFIVFGLPLETLHRIINVIGELAEKGRKLQDGSTSPDVLEGYVVQFRQVAIPHYREYFGYARWFYKGNQFPALQCVWPDAEGTYPWEAEAPQWIKDRQPLLDQ